MSDQQALSLIGHDLATSFIATTVETVLYTIFFMTTVNACIILLRTGRAKPSLASLLLSLAIVVMLILDTALWFIDIRNFVTKINGTLLSPTNDSLADKYLSVSTLSTLSLVAPLYSFMTVLGDGIFIWRVYAFWSKRKERWVIFIPSLPLLCTFICTAIIARCSSILGKNFTLGDFEHPALCKNVQSVAYGATAMTNAACTALIAYKAWSVNYDLSSFGVTGIILTDSETMILFVESGVIYFLFYLEIFISSLGTIASNENRSLSLALASTIYQYASSHVVGLYPTALVILARRHKPEPIVSRSRPVSGVQIVIEHTSSDGTAMQGSGSSPRVIKDTARSRTPSISRGNEIRLSVGAGGLA